MSGDIALVWDSANGRADFAMNPTGTDLALDAGLQTAVIISLFCDRLADPADTIPDGTDDRRGWWGDTPDPSGDTSPGQGSTGAIGSLDLTGSRLWLLARALQIPETLRRAEAYAQEALAWMIEDAIAGSITATAVFPAAPPNTLELAVTITEAGATEPTRFAFVWGNSHQ